MKGKLIVIEGNDCSGKETQSKKLVEYLNKNKIPAVRYAFPNYDSPTGKIVGGPFLGKTDIMESFFSEKAPNVDGKVASLYYAADRYYNINEINEKIDAGYTVILDRYIESNMAFQGSKIEDPIKRKEMYSFIEKLEYELLKLPRPDAVFLLIMPYEMAQKLKKNRDYTDDNENDENYLRTVENTYLELAKLYGYDIITCNNNDIILSIDDVHKKVVNEYNKVLTRKK